MLATLTGGAGAQTAFRAELVFAAVCSWVQLTYPATGVPPNFPDQMPFPVLIAFGVLALLGLATGGSSKASKKD